MTDISGFWEGSYVYPLGGAKVAFDVDLTQSAGHITGIISEPNTFDAEAGHLLTSVLAGNIISDKINFTKTYVGEGRAQHSITYDGKISDHGKRITGQWKIPNDSFSGLFEMTRLSGEKKVLHKASENIEI